MLVTLSDELLREMVIPPIVEEGAAVDAAVGGATEEAVGGTICIWTLCSGSSSIGNLGPAVRRLGGDWPWRVG